MIDKIHEVKEQQMERKSKATAGKWKMRDAIFTEDMIRKEFAVSLNEIPLAI